MPNVDFADLKGRVSLTDVLSMLNVTNLRHASGALRGPCPICGGDPADRHFVATEGKGWYCHHCRNGGDIIKLVAAVRQLDTRAAALVIQEHFGATPTGTVHRAPVPEGNRSVPQLQQILERLQPEHEAVQKLGISPLDPAGVLFNAHRITAGADLYLCRSPLDAILAVENGAPVDSVIAFCTPLAAAQQLEMLASFMDERKIGAQRCRPSPSPRARSRK